MKTPKWRLSMKAGKTVRPSDPRVVAAYDAWQSGADWDSIAAESGFNSGHVAMMAVRRHVARHDLPLRNANHERGLPHSKTRILESLEARESGVSWAEVAEKFGWASASTAQSSCFRWKQRQQRRERLAEIYRESEDKP